LNCDDPDSSRNKCVPRSSHLHSVSVFRGSPLVWKLPLTKPVPILNPYFPYS
jgi:hypothetical protein